MILGAYVPFSHPGMPAAADMLSKALEKNGATRNVLILGDLNVIFPNFSNNI